MKRMGEILFATAFLAAQTLYALTLPDGLPWNASTRLALAYLGEIVRFPVMPHPVWGFHVRVFYGPVALSVVCAALAAGLLAALVNRYFGWRFAAAAALVWIFLPGVWNRAITGERSICLAAMAVVAAWVLNAVALRVLRKVRATKRAARRSAPTTVGGDVLGAPMAHEEAKKRSKVNRIAGWVALGVAGVFAIVSLTLHDYRYGEAASVFAKGVVDAAGERVIVMNGVCDGQVVWEKKVKGEGQGRQRNLTFCAAAPLTSGEDAASPSGGRDAASPLGGRDAASPLGGRRSGEATSSSLVQNESGAKRPVHCPPPPHLSFLSTISLRRDDAYRTNLVAWVRSAFPADTNLWVAAQVGPQVFVDVATKRFPDRFYLMNGKSTTLEQWEKRWEDFRSCLDSSDPFVPVARRMFAYEGNGIANAMLDEKVKVEGQGQRRNLTSGAAAPLTSGEDAPRIAPPSELASLGGYASPSGGRRKGEATSSSLVQNESDAMRHVHSPTPTLDSNSTTAWRLYGRIYDEVDPGNFSALVNMSEMIRRGHAVSGDEKKKVQERLESFFKDANNRKHMREIARMAGPVRVDHEMLEKMAAEAKKRIAAKVAAGEKIEYSPEILSLLEWSREMFALMDKGETAKAGRIARAILSNPKWRDYLPANAVMGAVAASEGDYATSETFFRTATSTTNKVAVVVLNDYADTLMHLGKLDEAEKMARRAVAASDERYWVARLTLAQVLVEKREKVKVEGRGQEEKIDSSTSTQDFDTSHDEIRVLLKSVLKHAPDRIRERIRKEFRERVR